MVVREEFRADLVVMRRWVKPTLVRHDELTMMAAKGLSTKWGLLLMMVLVGGSKFWLMVAACRKFWVVKP